MEKQISEQTSKRITVSRYLMIFLVVLIHNTISPFELSKQDANLQFPAMVRFLQELLTGGIASCAVPIFFIFSSYLQGLKDYSYRILLKKKFHSLFVPYVVWNTIYIVAYLFLELSPIAKYIKITGQNNILAWNARNFADAYFGYARPDKGPIAFQFWFIRDLIILELISPLLKKFIKKLPVLALVLSFIVYLSGINLFLIKNRSLFFYIVGLSFAEYNVDFFEAADKVKWGEVIFLSLFFTVAKFFDFNTGTSFLRECAGIVLLLKLSGIMASNRFNMQKDLSHFSFFVFAMHAPFLSNTIIVLGIKLLEHCNIAIVFLLQYIIPPFLVFLLCVAVGKLLNKCTPPLFAILNGGR